MKIKKLLAVLIAVVLATSSVMSVSAATLSDVVPNSSMEVKANIVDPGFVSYVITIPESADFGTLTQPENTESDNYTFFDFQVEATELKIKSNQGVTVYVKDSASDDDQFYITQKDVSDPFKMQYSIYNAAVNNSNIGDYTALNQNIAGAYGYHLCTFLAGTEGSTQDVTLALNQNVLYNQDLSVIEGDYSGTILFHSALVEM
ncbi:MAG: hypothetical protein ACI4IM_10800 [Acutalibacteraceae bacterium]